MQALSFYAKRTNHRRENKPEIQSKQAHFVIAWNDWNDFGFKTLFSLHYFDSEHQWHRIGNVKVLHATAKRTELPATFSTEERLTDEYCSLGQEPEYYHRLIETFGRDDASQILFALRDIVISPETSLRFKQHPGFDQSLTRESSALGALRRCQKLLGFDPDADIELEHFVFSTHLKGFQKEHRIKLHFPVSGTLPHQISVLVGKNGTGKSGILARIADVMSGIRPENGQFEPTRPNFLRTLCISYGPFQAFEPPRQHFDSYVFCGLPSPQPSDEEQILKPWLDAFDTVVKDQQLELWRSLVGVRSLIGARAELVTSRREFRTEIKQGSSGQRLVVSILTQLLAELRPRCLVLFDEPEAYLHPSLLSTLLRQLVDLLKEKESHCIIATHSPVVVQEVPSEFVSVLRRVEDTPSVEPLKIECFGANLSEIVDQVFEVNEDDRNYQSHLRDMLQEVGNADAVAAEFQKGLPLNARIFLRSLEK